MAAVVLPEKFRHKVLNDSKQLSHARREQLYEEITNDERIRWHCVSIEVQEIDGYATLSTGAGRIVAGKLAALGETRRLEEHSLFLRRRTRQRARLCAVMPHVECAQIDTLRM